MNKTRKHLLATGEYYHVFNRSVASEEIWINKRAIKRTISLISFYKYPQQIRYSRLKWLSTSDRKSYLREIQKNAALVEVYAYAIMPDHFHLLIKQNQDEGIKKFVSNFQNSYAKYFNTKNDRHGSLFQHPFKSRRIRSDSQLLHVSRYIHLNPVTSYLVEYENILNYPWTSFREYLKLKKSGNSFVNTEFITNITGSKNKYISFVAGQSDYQRILKKTKKYSLSRQD